ncbi:hypothetical protein LSTR_LSTR004949 [Laodelphax striatellus]|uniref:Uncharacterized protein n=1 Tax=Laodelphax striatellus TaxID=195883 RepID=A0A482XP09_LAOST|nr:hypothetical protein LSTR_LSTR004949 [Laodelphax striatellus]
MQVQVASSSPLVLHVIVLLFVLNTITRTQIFSNAEETRAKNKRGYLRHPGYFSGKFGHLYSAEDFFPNGKNESIQAGFASSTSRQPLYRVSPAMFQQVGVGEGSNLKHGALRGDAAGPEENYNIAKHNHDEFPHIDPSSSIHNERNTGLKGKGRQTIAKLPQSIPYFEQNNRGTYKKGKGNNRPPSRFTVPPEYTKTTQPVHYTTERVTMHPTTTENNFFTTWPTTPGFKGKGHHKPATMFTIPPEFTQTTEPVYYPTEPVTMHPTTTETEIFTTHPTTSGIKKGKGHHKPASKFTIPSEYTRTTEPRHHQTVPVTSYPETTQQVYTTHPTTSGVKKGKGHHKPATMFTIPPEFTQTTEPVY